MFTVIITDNQNQQNVTPGFESYADAHKWASSFTRNKHWVRSFRVVEESTSHRIRVSVEG